MKGLELCDSMAWSLHKLMCAQIQCAVILIKEKVTSHNLNINRSIIPSSNYRNHLIGLKSVFKSPLFVLYHLYWSHLGHLEQVCSRYLNNNNNNNNYYYYYYYYYKNMNIYIAPLWDTTLQRCFTKILLLLVFDGEQMNINQFFNVCLINVPGRCRIQVDMIR